MAFCRCKLDCKSTCFIVYNIIFFRLQKNLCTLNLAIPLATVQDTFFGPPSFPAGPTASYVEAPLQPYQKCHVSAADSGNYKWDRNVACYVGLPGKFVPGSSWASTDFLPITNPTICAKMGLPAYKTDFSSYGPYAGDAPAVMYTYNGRDPKVVPFCNAGYNVSTWGARGNITG